MKRSQLFYHSSNDVSSLSSEVTVEYTKESFQEGLEQFLVNCKKDIPDAGDESSLCLPAAAFMDYMKSVAQKNHEKFQELKDKENGLSLQDALDIVEVSENDFLSLLTFCRNNMLYTTEHIIALSTDELNGSGIDKTQDYNAYSRDETIRSYIKRYDGLINFVTKDEFSTKSKQFFSILIDSLEKTEAFADRTAKRLRYSPTDETVSKTEGKLYVYPDKTFNQDFYAELKGRPSTSVAP